MNCTKYLIAFSFLLLFGCSPKSDSQAYQATIDSLTAVINSKNVLAENAVNYWFDDEIDGKQLAKAGINEPEEFIINQFRAQTDLFPIQEVLGGTMRFGKVQVLSKKWLIADFEDGHLGGKAIYSFHMKNEKLIFELIDFVPF